MKIYIIDDDINVIKMLENIIEDNSLGDIVGYQTNSEKVINELLILKPDIIILDFLMPKIDGRQLIIKMKANLISSNFIMLSKVTDKDMIGDIYDLGIEFFINKPINNKEIVSILNNVIQKIKLKQKENKEPPEGNSLSYILYTICFALYFMLYFAFFIFLLIILLYSILSN